MKFLGSLLSSKILRGAWFLFLGLIGFIIISNDLVHFQVEKKLGSQETVAQKPSIRAIVTEDSDVKSGSGHSIGQLYKDTLVYIEEKPRETQKEISSTLYGWIWAGSVTDRDEFLVLKTDENVRYRANSSKLGRLKSGTILRRQYLNDAQSWYLFTTQVFIPFSKIRLVDSPKKKGVWSWFTSPRSIVTVTSKQGGIPVTYNVLEPTILILFVILTSITGLFRLRRIPSEQRKDFYLELVKSVLQIAVGVLLAFLIFGLGLK